MFNMATAIFVFVFALFFARGSDAYSRGKRWSDCDSYGDNQCLKYHPYTATYTCQCCDGYYRTLDGFCKRLPRFLNCPKESVKVHVHRYENKAILNKTLMAEDWMGQALSVTYSQTNFRHCKCSNTRIIVFAKSADDFNGKAAYCRFTVTVEDAYDPVIKGCPHGIYTSDKNRIQWKAPKIEDNVGIKTLQHPYMKNNTRFKPGYYTLIYNATDFDGNMATCVFTVFVYNSQTYTKSTDTSVIISGTVIAALMVLLVVMSFAMVRIFKKRRQLRNRHPVAYYGAQLARSGSGNSENPVFFISSGPPSYDDLFADKPPDYTDVSYLPSYEHYQRLTAQSSCAMTRRENIGQDNIAFVGCNETQRPENAGSNDGQTHANSAFMGNEGQRLENPTYSGGNDGHGHANLAFVDNEDRDISNV